MYNYLLFSSFKKHTIFQMNTNLIYLIYLINLITSRKPPNTNAPPGVRTRVAARTSARHTTEPRNPHPRGSGDTQHRVTPSKRVPRCSPPPVGSRFSVLEIAPGGNPASAPPLPSSLIFPFLPPVAAPLATRSKRMPRRPPRSAPTAPRARFVLCRALNPGHALWRRVAHRCAT